MRFAENIEKAESADPPASDYKEIKPVFDVSEDKVHSFWDEVFGEECTLEKNTLSDDEIISEIYGRNEDEFKFDFDIQDKKLQEILNEFSEDNWNELSEPEKKELITEFATLLAEKLGIENIPKITFFEADKDFCGAFNHRDNVMEINRNIFDNPKELIDTIAHEMRHSYQYQRACIGETYTDILYAYNFLNYIEPQMVDKAYVNFIDYQDQFIEAEARAFAKLFYN